MATEPVKIDKWDSNACKNSLDDAAKKYFSENLKMVESFKLMDSKLVICTVSVFVAIFACLWDWLYPFPQSKTVLISCSLLYFFFTGIFSFYLMFVEKHVFYVGYEKDIAGMDPDNKWSLSSTIKRFSPLYQLQVSCVNGVSGKHISKEASYSVEEFFDEKGRLVTAKFNTILSNLKTELKKEIDNKGH